MIFQRTIIIYIIYIFLISVIYFRMVVGIVFTLSTWSPEA